MQEIADIYCENNGNYSYLRVKLKLRATMKINHKRVQSIMQKLGLKGNVNNKNIVRIKVM
ncbi:hypothetical protein SC1083_2067 [Aggregatibacter actinomycetemcomitans serotype e str. SC1083]|uniref:HTH-like domain-containing protein n=1 Tax=Aggregatibacter actinomycetemcomitans serotype e str. SC1083 TaxID=907488 RepID=G4AB36_AGGAC|nr:hypothetical protein SC1083_2067 [Aggregatibacter actinomycetemcomitans serotype e str. SC1083]